jgi:UDP-N-acetyl-D-mannosaminuronate dehydrogenase
VVGLGYVGLPLALNSGMSDFPSWIDCPRKVDDINRGVSYIQDLTEVMAPLVTSGKLKATTDFRRWPN